jgi:hypothetical protein
MEAPDDYERLKDKVNNCLGMGAELTLAGLLNWTADRLVNVHGENPNVDYIIALRERAIHCARLYNETKMR